MFKRFRCLQIFLQKDGRHAPNEIPVPQLFRRTSHKKNQPYFSPKTKEENQPYFSPKLHLSLIKDFATAAKLITGMEVDETFFLETLSITWPDLTQEL